MGGTCFSLAGNGSQQGMPRLLPLGTGLEMHLCYPQDVGLSRLHPGILTRGHWAPGDPSLGMSLRDIRAINSCGFHQGSAL